LSVVLAKSRTFSGSDRIISSRSTRPLRQPVLHQGIKLRGRHDFADHVVHPVAAQRLPHVLQLPQQAVHDLALTGVLGDEVEDHDLVFLLVAVDAAHPLFEPVGVPRNVVVDHQRAELEVDALAGRFRGDYDRRLVLEEVPLGLDPLLQGHPAVDGAAVEAQVGQLAHEEVERVLNFRPCPCRPYRCAPKKARSEKGSSVDSEQQAP
jgi:hypothetical protein